MPWPFRWAVWAIVMGFCAAIGLWAFEFGKNIAGLEKGSRAELLALREQVLDLQAALSVAEKARDQAQSIANTAGTLVTAEKSSQERLVAQVKQLEADNRALRGDLGFFEKLIPVTGVDGVSIRGLQAELIGGSTVKWQVLVIQANKNAPEFGGRMDVSFSGLLNGKPWSASLVDGPQAIKIRQYGRAEGQFELPPQVILKGVTAKLMDGATVRATQSIKL
ncbi:DUF6776 family protein [Rhodoferax aquaticus]